MGAHVWWPWFLEHHWFPKCRLSGWSPDWYAGFPVGQYYFPFPALMVALARPIPFVPVQRRVQARDRVAARCMLPAARVLLRTRACARRGRRRPRSRSRRSGMLVQTRNDWQIYGGNIASTLAGEFSFTIALALAPVRARRARVHARHREAPMAARGADRGGGHVAHRRRDLRRASRRSCCGSRAGRSRTWPHRVAGRRRRGRAHRGVVAAAASRARRITQSMRYDEGRPGGQLEALGFRRLLLPGPGRAHDRGRRARRSAPRPRRRGQAIYAAAVAAVVDLAARRRRDRRGRLVPPALDARAARRSRSCSA